jgi:mycothione reductase
MKQYDILVVGSGCGLIIVEEAVSRGLKVALLDRGPLGGTCLNVGCIPSKMLICVADRIVEIQGSRRLGVRSKVSSIDFEGILNRTMSKVEKYRAHIRGAILRQKNLDYFEGLANFVNEKTMEINGKKLQAGKIFLAAGTRPFIPSIRGLESVDYLTNETALALKEKPESMIIIGGGYIAVEFGHFFAAMGTKVTILEMADRLVNSEEAEISELLKKELSARMVVVNGQEVSQVKKMDKNGKISVSTREKLNGKAHEYTADKIMVAVGRKSNADLLKTENCGIQTDSRGFINVNGYMQTSNREIYAVGDINGQQMFTHVANIEAALAVDHLLLGSKKKMDYSAAPHAVFSSPQIASVGLTEKAAKEKFKIRVGRARYSDVAYGQALREKTGFAKVIVEADTDKILGFHIIGPMASVLIQEVINVIQSKRRVHEIFAGMHIHPALSELIPETLGNS